jgi:Tfp pilus assembly protein PilW
MSAERGAGLVEALVAAAIGVLLLSVVTSMLAAGAHGLGRAGARAEASDTAGLAAEAFLFDVRRAGFDPAAAGVLPLTLARSDRFTVHADVNGDGVVDAGSAERTTWICNAGAQRLSRQVGAQSMPLADGVVACTFEYFDAAATPLVPPAAGLDPTALARVATLGLTLRLVPRGGGTEVERRLTVALRSQP